MDLVQVDRVDAEPLEARVDLSQDRVALQRLHRLATGPLDLAGLGEDERRRGAAFERASDDLLGVAEAVLRRGVDPVDPEVERVVDGRDRLFVVLRAPAPVVVGAADRPRAEADAGDLEARGPELSRLHEPPSRGAVVVPPDPSATACRM